MAHYSRLRGWVSRPSRPVDTGPSPYDPESSRFAERHRETETALPGGLVRIDVGEPIKPLAAEGLRQTVKVKPPLAFVETPAADLMPPAQPHLAKPSRPRRDPWGLNRDGR